MSQGASQFEVAGELDVSEETFWRWKREIPDFNEAVKIGLNKSKLWWLKSGRMNLENKEFSYTGWYMNMKNRFGWTDKQENKNTTTINVHIDGIQSSEILTLSEDSIELIENE